MKLFKGNVFYKPGEIPLQTNEGTKVIQGINNYLTRIDCFPIKITTSTTLRI